MKKLKWITAVLAMAAVLFAGCSGGSDDDDRGPDWNASASISFDSFAKDDIVRNRVVSGSSGNVYYDEYLEFISATTGNYHLYKVVHQNDATEDGFDEIEKLTENPFATGDDKSLPDSFSYSASNGKVTVGGVATYIFSTETSKYAAEEVCAPAEGTDKSSLFRGWKAGDRTYTFKNGGKAVCSDVSEELSYTNDGGDILVNGNIPFCWTSDGSGGKNLYYNARKTERGKENSLPKEKSRAAASGSTEITFVSDGLLFARAR